MRYNASVHYVAETFIKNHSDGLLKPIIGKLPGKNGHDIRQMILLNHIFAKGPCGMVYGEPLLSLIQCNPQYVGKLFRHFNQVLGDFVPHQTRRRSIRQIANDIHRSVWYFI